jgi:hypothetical protein
LGAGFVGILNDDGANANVYLAATTTTGWWIVALTLATNATADTLVDSSGNNLTDSSGNRLTT